MKKKVHRKPTHAHHAITSELARKAALIATLAIVATLVFVFLITSKSASAVDSAADVIISTAIGPNTNSGSWNGWAFNAIRAIQTGELEVGDPSSPQYYKELLADSAIDPSMVITSNFRSWLGQANPGVVFGEPFTYENGNTLRFIYMLRAKAGTKIDAVNGVTFYVKPNSWKPNGVGPFTYNEYMSTIVYPNILVGIDYGADGQYGGGDDLVRSTGTGPVDAIVGTFTTEAELSTLATSDPQDPQHQAALDAAKAYIMGLGGITNTFQVGYGTDPVTELAVYVGPQPTPTTIPTPTEQLTPTPVVMHVGVDIRPNAYKNMINLKSRGLLGVAVLSASGFNPKDVDSDTVLFAGANAVRVNMRDVNKDRVRDMVIYFKISDLQINSTSTSATLTGKLKSGALFEGTDSLTMVPKSEEVDEVDLED